MTTTIDAVITALNWKRERDLEGEAKSFTQFLKDNGFVIVPIEPTEEMLSVGFEEYNLLLNGKIYAYPAVSCLYKAMITAGKEEK